MINPTDPVLYDILKKPRYFTNF